MTKSCKCGKVEIPFTPCKGFRCKPCRKLKDKAPTDCTDCGCSICKAHEHLPQIYCYACQSFTCTGHNFAS